MKKAHTGRYSRQYLQDAPRLGAIGITRRRYDETVTPLPPDRTGLHSCAPVPHAGRDIVSARPIPSPALPHAQQLTLPGRTLAPADPTGRYGGKALPLRPASCVLKLRLLAEALTQDIADRLGLHLVQATQADHDIGYRDGLEALKVAREIALWFHRSFGTAPEFTPCPFVLPDDPCQNLVSLQQQIATTLAKPFSKSTTQWICTPRCKRSTPCSRWSTMPLPTTTVPSSSTNCWVA